MLGILLDSAVLLGILKLLLGDDAPEFVHIVLVALGIAVVNFACLLGLGYWGLIPIVLLNGLILMFSCSLDLKQTSIALAIFMPYKIAITIAFSALFG